MVFQKKIMNGFEKRNEWAVNVTNGLAISA